MSTATSIQDAGYVAVTEKIESAGAIVWWRLSGGLDLAHLEEKWREQGLPVEWLPEPPSPEVALHRAVCEFRTATRLVRPLKSGWALIEEQRSGEGEQEQLTHVERFRASLNKVCRPTVSGYVNNWAFDNAKVRAKIEADFDVFSETLTQSDLPGWLSRMMSRVSATPLRPTGGIYFVPRYAMLLWEKVVGSLRATSSHRVFGVPAMHTSEALDAIQDAIEQEAQSEIETIEKQLTEMSLGVRALETRVSRTEDVERKLSSYEELLGRRAEAMHEKIQRLRANITVAITKAEQAAEEAAGRTP